MSRRKMQFADDGWGGSAKKRSSDAELDITPMIDVTFLLLIFFMVASTMQPSPNQNVPATDHGLGLERKNAIMFFIMSDGSKNSIPEILGEEKDSNGNLVQYSIETFASKVRAESQSGLQRVILQGDGRVPSGFINELFRSIAEVPNVQYNVGVRPKKR